MSGRTGPSDIVGNVRSDVARRIPQVERLRDGTSVPNGMDMYLAGYSDAHYRVKDELEKLESLMEQFDKELEDHRQNDD